MLKRVKQAPLAQSRRAGRRLNLAGQTLAAALAALCGPHTLAQNASAPNRSNNAAAPRVLLGSPPLSAVDGVTGIVHSRRMRSGVPLGGIGAGTFQLMTDGTVGQAAVAGNWQQPLMAAPGCFAALWTRTETRSTARVLALNSAYNLPTVTKLDYDGLYPQANLTFPDASPLVQTSLLAFSPLIPFDVKNSSFPAAALVMRLKNLTNAPVEAGIALAWESLLPAGSAAGQISRVPVTIFPSGQGYFGARFGANRGQGGQNGAGGAEMTLMAYPQRAQAVVTTALWDAASEHADWWEAFAKDGSVPDGKPGETSAFVHPAAVVSVRITLKPGEAVDLPFAVSWYLRSPRAADTHTENSDSSAVSDRADGSMSANPGHYYEIAFAGADDAAMQLLEDWRSLYGLTEEWQKRLTFSNMPRWMSRRIINSAAPLSANTIHTRDGRFAFLGTVGRGADAVVSVSMAEQANSPERARTANVPAPLQDGAGVPVVVQSGANAPAASQEAADAAEAERETTWSHECADALLLAFFPQIAAQELAQFTATQDSRGFVAPPADANWHARLGPAKSALAPLIPNGSGLFVLPPLGAKPAGKKPAGTKAGQPSVGKPPAGSAVSPQDASGVKDAGSANKTQSTLNSPGSSNPPPASPALAPLDATAAYVLQTARFALWTGDPDDIKRYYPGAQRAVRALLSLRDANGLPANARPASLTLWLATLRAGQRLAALAGDSALNRECEAAVKQGGASLDAGYWNGEFYQDAPLVRSAGAPNRTGKRLKDGAANGVGSKPGDKAQPPLLRSPAPDAVCATDQLWGQWPAYQLDLGPLLPPEHLLRAARSVQERNDRVRSAPNPAAGGALLPAWQARVDGMPPDSANGSDCLLPASILADAAVNIWQDQPEAGVGLLRRLEDGRDNLLLSPWQYSVRARGEGERGRGGERNEHASDSSILIPHSALSSLADAADWNLLYALQGFALDISAGQLTLAPNIPGTWREFNAPVFAPTFWGRMEYRPTVHGGITTFRLDRLIGFVTAPTSSALRSRAELTLQRLRVLGPPRREDNTQPTQFTAHVSVGQKPIGLRATQDAAGFITLTFDSPLSLTAGDRLEVDVH